MCVSCTSEVQQQEQAALSLLYHLSVDDKCKSLFTYTDCIPIVSAFPLTLQRLVMLLLHLSFSC